MNPRTAINITALGPNWLKTKVSQAAARLLRSGDANSDAVGPIVVVHADYGGPGRGPAGVWSILADGAAAVLGVAPARAHRTRLEFFEAGAADVLLASAPVSEWSWRLARIERWEARTAEQMRSSGEQQALFQAVVDSLPESLHAIDRAFRIAVWNRAREAGPLGRPRGQVLGQDLFTAVNAAPELRQEYEEVFRTGQPCANEVESNPGGVPQIYRVEKVPMRLSAGPEVTHVVTFARNITTQRLLERSMAQAEKLAAVGRLAAGIAHEISNPLATIAGCAESLRSRLAEPLIDDSRREAAADAGVIESEAYRCKEILGGLLDFSRTKPDERRPCEPAQVVERTARLLRHNPRVANVRLSVEIDEQAPVVWANEDQLVQVLLALAINAADAASPGGAVTIRAGRHAEGGAILSVEDNGPGIPPEIADHIFEPFFTTKPPGQGTGLGLSVAYGLVQAHNGRLDFQSRPGVGTRFEVVLPAGAEKPAEVLS